MEERPRAGRGPAYEVYAVFDGHPVHLRLLLPTGRSRSRTSEGYPARMLPARFGARLPRRRCGHRPGCASGFVSYEATGFLLHRRVPESTATLVLCQAAFMGERFAAPDGHGSRLGVLVDYLCRFYPPEHETIVYKASLAPVVDPIVKRVALGELRQDVLPLASSPRHPRSFRTRGRPRDVQPPAARARPGRSLNRVSASPRRGRRASPLRWRARRTPRRVRRARSRPSPRTAPRPLPQQHGPRRGDRERARASLNPRWRSPHRTRASASTRSAIASRARASAPAPSPLRASSRAVVLCRSARR